MRQSLNQSCRSAICCTLNTIHIVLLKSFLELSHYSYGNLNPLNFLEGIQTRTQWIVNVDYTTVKHFEDYIKRLEKIPRQVQYIEIYVLWNNYSCCVYICNHFQMTEWHKRSNYYNNMLIYENYYLLQYLHRRIHRKLNASACSTSYLVLYYTDLCSYIGIFAFKEINR